MAIKRKLSKEEYEKLPDILKSEYQEKDGSFVVLLDGDDELRRAKDHEVNAHKETRDKLKELQSQLDAMRDNKSRESGDVKALEESWRNKLTEREAELSTKINSLQSSIVSTMRDSVLTDLASKLVKPDASRLFKKSLEDRLQVDLSGDRPEVRILDNKGQRSAMSISDLEKEIVASPEYSSIIIASKASGGAGVKATGNGVSEAGKKPNLATMKPEELVAHFKSIKEE